MSTFNTRLFSECDVNDHFFDSLKEDYQGFAAWFARKGRANEHAYVFEDDGSIQAFLYIKDVDDEEIPGVFPRAKRMKIGTLKISEGSQGQRLGEGAVGIALWRWQQSDLDEIYVTVFDKHSKLISILESFGFQFANKKADGENVYVKDKRKMQYDTAKHSFPYLDPSFNRGKYIPVNEEYHDQLFQYSELRYVKRSDEDATAASNGLSKVFVATPFNGIDYRPGDIGLIYRIHTGGGSKTHKSVVTSYCTIVRQTPVKENDAYVKTLDEFLSIVGNKSVYSRGELTNIYKDSRNNNVVVIEMVYNGYFGAGHNVNHATLKGHGLFEKHPYLTELSKDEVLEILGMGGKDVQDIIIN
jgi:hypothetical protein